MVVEGEAEASVVGTTGQILSYIGVALMWTSLKLIGSLSLSEVDRALNEDLNTWEQNMERSEHPADLISDQNLRRVITRRVDSISYWNWNGHNMIVISESYFDYYLVKKHLRKSETHTNSH